MGCNRAGPLPFCPLIEMLVSSRDFMCVNCSAHRFLLLLFFCVRRLRNRENTQSSVWRSPSSLYTQEIKKIFPTANGLRLRIPTLEKTKLPRCDDGINSLLGCSSITVPMLFFWVAPRLFFYIFTEKQTEKGTQDEVWIIKTPSPSTTFFLSFLIVYISSLFFKCVFRIGKNNKDGSILCCKWLRHFSFPGDVITCSRVKGPFIVFGFVSSR